MLVDDHVSLFIAAFMVLRGENAPEVVHIEDRKKQGWAVLQDTPVVGIMVATAPIRVDVLPWTILVYVVNLSEKIFSN